MNIVPIASYIDSTLKRECCVVYLTNVHIVAYVWPERKTMFCDIFENGIIDNGRTSYRNDDITYKNISDLYYLNNRYMQMNEICQFIQRYLILSKRNAKIAKILK